MFDTPEPSRTLKTLFGALVFVMGAQSIRFLFGSITWYLRDTVGIGTLQLIPIALAPFLVGATLPILSRWLTVRGALWSGVWLLVLARTFNQISGDPAIDFWTAAAATATFVGLLPLMLSMGRSAVVGGILLGLALDSAIKGMGLSLDLAFQTGIAPLAAVIALAVATLYVFWACPPIERQGVTWGSGILLLGVAPLLFFEFLILQNQGWTAEVTGIGGPQAQLRIALLNVVTMVAVGWLERNRWVVFISLAVLIGALATAEGDPLVFNLLSLLAIPAAGLVLAAMVPDVEERGIGASASYLVTGMTLFVVLGLVYYVPMDLDLGFTQQQARSAAMVLMAVFGLAAAVSLPATRPGVTQQAWAFAALASLLPLLGFFLAGRVTDTADVGNEPIRFVAYNIHSSYNTTGMFDIEAIATVIEDSGATVVGLQEVPRGRLISGVTDQLTLLKHRLGFEHVAFFGTTDPTWGNAILSRFPISSTERVFLPLESTLLQRGYLGANLVIGDDIVLFVSTHLQHVNDPDFHDEDPEADLYPVHHAQIATILTEWGGREPAVLVGDFNARPHWRQIQELLEAGWVDSWDEAGQGDGFTSNAIDPMHRIDYVFHTPDLVAIDAGVIQSQASDHLPVAADIQTR